MTGRLDALYVAQQIFVPALKFASISVAAGPRFFFAHFPAETEPSRSGCTGFVRDTLDPAPKTAGKSCKKLHTARESVVSD